MSDLDNRLQSALSLRDRLARESQRIAGRLEAAENNLRDVEDEIRAKKLDPDTLEETLTTLEAAYEKAVVQFEGDLADAQKHLTPYLESSP